VTSARFASAVERVRGRLGQTRADRAIAIRNAVERAAENASRITRFVAYRGNTHYLVPIAEIDWIEADGNYLCLHTRGHSHLVRETMKNAELRLDPNTFVRIHRSTIVAVDRIATIRSREHGEHTLTLKDGTTLDSSRAYADRVRQLMR
jgi:two-component system LytT family response regulator